MSMFTNTASKVLNFAGIISVALGALSAWIALGPAKLTAKNTPFWPFVVAGLIALVVVFALAKARRKPRQPRSTTPLTFTWGVVIAIVVVTALVVSGMSALSALLVAGTLKITLTAFWWSILWGIIAGGLAGLGMAIINRAIARARTI